MESSMTRFGIINAAVLGFATLAVTPAAAQQPQAGAVGRSAVSAPNATVAAPSGGAVAQGSAGATISAGASVRSSAAAQQPIANPSTAPASAPRQFSTNSW